MGKKEAVPLWVHGTLLVESEMLNRRGRQTREATLAACATLAVVGLLALVRALA